MSDKARRETWRDWVPPNVPEPRLLLTRVQLVEWFRTLGIDVTENDLRFWEYKGILPHPVRQRYEGATRALYPDWFVPLVARLRQLQDRDKLSLEQIRSMLRPYVAIALADGLSLSEVPISVRPPSNRDPREELSHALADFVAWVQRTYHPTAPIVSAVVSFRDEKNEPVSLLETGLPLEIVTHAAGTPALSARSSMAWASAGLVAKATSPGIPAARQRAGSSAQLAGR